MRIVFLGAGNVAHSLIPALHKCGQNIVQIYSQHLSSTDDLSQYCNERTDDLKHLLLDADCYIYCLTDNAIPIIINELERFSGDKLNQKLHLHTAGSVELSVYPKKWTRVGILYPFSTFSRSIVQQMNHVPLLIEAINETTLNQTRNLANQLSDMVYDANSEQRGLVHLAGTFVNNFGNCMAVLAKEQLDKAKLPFDIILPIMQETVNKLHHLSPEKAQSGAAARKDTNTIKKHLDLIENEKVKEVYKCLTEIIMAYS